MTAFSRACLLFVLAAGAVRAQGTGGIHGSVSDPSQLGVQNVVVRATHIERGFTRHATTNEHGDYVLPLLPVGTYLITVEQPGFKAYRRRGIGLTANENVRIDIRLELGTVTDTVVVNADAPLVDTRSSQVATLIDSRRVTELPINGRNIVALMQLLPGVGQISTPQLLVEDRDGPTVSVGSRVNQNLFLFDGAHYNALFRNTGLNYPPPDALQEVKVLTNSFSAEYGRNAGAIVNAITRSGTNQFHGTVWEFLRHHKLNARNFFAGETKPKLIQNQFGGAGGGPIRRNTLFFFGSYERLTIRPDALSSSAFPLTTAERRGDFSGASTPVRDPLTGQPFPGNQIPASRFDTVAKNILDRNLMPLPNRPDGQLVELAPTPRNNDQFLIRLDWNKGRHTVDGRYNFNQARTTDTAGQVPSYITINGQTRGQNVTIGETFTISPRVVNQLRVSFNRMANFSDAFNIQSHADLGGALPQFGPPLPPNIVISGRVTLSNASPTVPGRANETYQISDNVTLSLGAHTVKAGVDVFKARLVAYSAVNTMGVFTFNGQVAGNPAAEFLIGRPATMLIGSPVRETGGKQTSFYAFAQDDWKVSRKLTLNLGLRYELPLPWYHPNNFWSTVRPGVQSQVIPSAPVGLVFPGDPGVPRGLIATDKNNFAPRFGFAWDPAGNGRTSVRGAYGIFYEAITGEIIANDGQPFSYSFTIPMPFSLTDPLRGQPPIPTTVNMRDPLFVGLQQVSYPDPNYCTGYVQQINFNVQRQLRSTLAIQAAYVGRLGRKQMMTLAANPAIFRPGSTLANINQRRIMPEFGNNRTSTSQSNSSYHAFQFELTKRMSLGLSLQGSYTFSRAVDLASAIVGGIAIAPPNTFDLSAEHGLSDFHAKHIGSFSWLWEIPKTPLANRFAKAILDNWQANGLVALRTGRPFNVITGRDDALSGTPNQRPNVVGEHRLSDDRPRGDKVLRWFDRTAFAFPQTGTYGNAGRNALIGPPSANTNVAFFKTFPITATEGLRLQFRSEFFNVFNSVTFGNPVRDLTAGERMGRITFAEDARVIQFALKLMF